MKSKPDVLKPSSEKPLISHSLSGERLKVILDNLYDEVVVIDKNDRIIYANKASEKHYSETKSSLLGKKVFDVPAWSNWEPNTLPIVKKYKKKITIEQTSPLGEKILTTATPVLTPDNEIEMIVYNVRDVAQLESVKQDLELTRKLLEGIETPTGEKTFSLPEYDLIAHDPKMHQIIDLAAHVAVVDATILLQGESGTGKGIFAKFIHNRSLRKEAAFLVINCAAIPENLLEAELFGYAPGTFTGGHRDGKTGLIELAHGGTLFLDEIGELSPNLQAKFLHVIQDKQFIPLGSRTVKKVDVRIIAATNRQLQEMIKTGEFREDLYYRLNVIGIHIPPLRERMEDIAPLAYTFLRQFDQKYHTSHDISAECLETLTHSIWNGNVRELENLMERLVVTVRETLIENRHLPPRFFDASTVECKALFPTNTPLEDLLLKIEKDMVIRAYKTHQSSRKVAKSLKISQTKASRLIRKHIPSIK